MSLSWIRLGHSCPGFFFFCHLWHDVALLVSRYSLQLFRSLNSQPVVCFYFVLTYILLGAFYTRFSYKERAKFLEFFFSYFSLIVLLFCFSMWFLTKAVDEILDYCKFLSYTCLTYFVPVSLLSDFFTIPVSFVKLNYTPPRLSFLLLI